MDKVDHRRAFTIAFAGPDWPLRLLLVAAGMLVPLVGPVAVNGYQATIAERVPWRPDDLPPVDLQRLVDYLLRGLRVFVVSVLVGLLLMPIAMVVMFATVLLSAGAGAVLQDSCAGGPVLLLISLIGGLLFMAVIYGGMALATPLWLQAAINPDLAGALDFAFVKDFLARVGRQVIVSHLVLMLFSLAAFVAGVLACVVGVFPAMALVMIAQAHIYGQLYALYLARGGRPIPAAPAVAIAA
jgi:hypothetical protein